MTPNQTGSKTIAVIGGGITGLAVAHRLTELDPRMAVTLFEASSRLGGVLETIRREGFLIEGGADNFITSVPFAVDLCRRIGFQDRLVETSPKYRGAFVVRRSRLRKIPEGFVVMAPSRCWPIIATPILSPWGKLRLAAEYFVPARAVDGDESLASFVTRRLGRETYERLVQPLIGGIYTGDPEKLSLQATMPRFCEMERSAGSLIRALWRQASENRSSGQRDGGARYSMFVAPRDGMSSLIEAIAARLPEGYVQVNSRVTSIRPTEDHKWLVSAQGGRSQTGRFDAVVVTTPAPVTATLMKDIDTQLTDQLLHIPHTSCAIVSLGYRRDQIGHPLDGFGFVVPRIENRRVLSASFASVKYPGRAPDGAVLVRVFLGGACQSELAEVPTADLQAIAAEELADLLDIRGNPMLAHVSRRPHAMPQYYVGHAERVAKIERQTALFPGLFLAGNAYRGVGIPSCIQDAERAADNVFRQKHASHTDVKLHATTKAHS